MSTGLLGTKGCLGVVNRVHYEAIVLSVSYRPYALEIEECEYITCPILLLNTTISLYHDMNNCVSNFDVY